MKVLWVTNIPFDYHLELLGLSTVVASGSWLCAAYEAAKTDPNIQLHIVTVANVRDVLVGEKNGHLFYVLPQSEALEYDITSDSHLKEWEYLRERVSPDIVVIWGTEKRFAYLALKVMQNIPIAIYIQGVISSIYRSYYYGVPHKYIKYTLRDRIDLMNRYSTYNTFKRQVILEQKMLKMATAVIVESDWCEDMCRSVNNNLIVYRNSLPIRAVFRSKKWSLDSMSRHTVFTNAGGYPIKGHHILFEAIGIVKQIFPDVKCFVPGPDIELFSGIKRRTGYIQLLFDIIRKYSLENNVIYTGVLDGDRMVEYLSNSNVYVMPSTIENHSASLIEAMFVGTPCVSSLVGGTASIIRHGINGFLYDSLDAISLAGYIIRIFENDNLACSFSKEALKIRIDRQSDFGHEMTNICRKLISDSKCM